MGPGSQLSLQAAPVIFYQGVEGDLDAPCISFR